MHVPSLAYRHFNNYIVKQEIELEKYENDNVAVLTDPEVLFKC
jgi:hypothetical protein